MAQAGKGEVDPDMRNDSDGDNTSMLPRLTIDTGPQPKHSVIWLHGLGADGHDFEPIVPELGLPETLPVRFIFPHAPAMPVTLNGGYVMPAWYDIRQSDLGIEHDAEGVRQSSKAIQLMIEQEIMRGIAPGNIMLAGFSQGAAMSLHVGLRQTTSLAGIIALSGYLMLPDRVTVEASQASRTTPLFMAHGVNDPVVPFALGDKACRKLQSLGYTVNWHVYPMQHQVCMEEIRHIGRFIQETFSRS